MRDDPKRYTSNAWRYEWLEKFGAALKTESNAVLMTMMDEYDSRNEAE